MYKYVPCLQILPIFLFLSSALLQVHYFFKHFICYGHARDSGWCNPGQLYKLVFSGFHGQKPQGWKQFIAEHSIISSSSIQDRNELFCQDFAYATLGLLLSIPISVIWKLQHSKVGWVLWHMRKQRTSYAQFRAEFTQLIILHGYSVDNLTWVWSPSTKRITGNLALCLPRCGVKIFQYFHIRLLGSSIQKGCISPPSHQKISLWFQLVSLCKGISAWVDTFQKQRRWTQLLWMLLQGLYKIHTHFCPLCTLKRFQSLGKVGNLIHHW